MIESITTDSKTTQAIDPNMKKNHVAIKNLFAREKPSYQKKISE